MLDYYVKEYSRHGIHSTCKCATANAPLSLKPDGISKLVSNEEGELGRRSRVSEDKRLDRGASDRMQIAGKARNLDPYAVHWGNAGFRAEARDV